MGCIWLLTIALAQTPAIQDGVAAQLAFLRGTQLADAGNLVESVAAFRLAAERLEADSIPPSPALMFKAGNARLLAGDLPYAIAAYRRGLTLDPADGRLRMAIEYAREQVQYLPASDAARLLRPERDLWPVDLSLRSIGGWAFVLYFAGCLALTRWRMTRGRRWPIAAGVLFAGALIPVFGSSVEWWRARRNDATPVVVTVRDAPLRVGNGSEYTSKVDLPRGCEVRRLFERGGWIQVETGGGAVGWLPANAVVGP